MSISSCLVRNDYNVIFGIFILLILNNFYKDNPKLFTKIIIQMLAVLVVADLIWIIVMSGAWSHDEENNKYPYWQAIEGMHTFGIVMAYLELILKGLFIVYLGYDFKGKYEISKFIICDHHLGELWSFSYNKSPNQQDNNTNISAANANVNPGGMTMANDQFKSMYE
jgi:hypothetical protein